MNKLKIVIAGGTGFLGKCIINNYIETPTEFVILTRGESRTQKQIQYVHWDGKNAGPWTAFLEGANAVINLNVKSVDCRYTEKNKRLIYSTRLDSTAAIGKAIQECTNPPELWINASSATIYRHSVDKEMDEYTGELGSGFSVDVCQKWEQTFNSIQTPGTRKVLIRTGIVLGENGGALQPLIRLVKVGFGGNMGNGNQYFSWLHEDDFVKIIDYIMTHPEMKGVYNLTAPAPVPNHHVMKVLRSSLEMPFGLPLPKWLLEFGALLINTETELVLKSRRVIPRRLLEDGYLFKFDRIEDALAG